MAFAGEIDSKIDEDKRFRTRVVESDRDTNYCLFRFNVRRKALKLRHFYPAGPEVDPPKRGDSKNECANGNKNRWRHESDGSAVCEQPPRILCRCLLVEAGCNIFLVFLADWSQFSVLAFLSRKWWFLREIGGCDWQCRRFMMLLMFCVRRRRTASGGRCSRRDRKSVV